MAQRIVIENDIARYEEINTVAEVPLGDLMPHLQTRLPTIFPMLPDNTRVIAFNPATNHGAVLVELAPTRRTIRASVEYGNLQSDSDHNRDEDGLSVFTLAFPYTIFAFGFTFNTHDDRLTDFGINSWRLFYRNARITSMNDPLWIARLMNVDEYGGICWGDTRVDTEDLTQRIDGMVKSFSRTIFNTDLQQRRPGGYRSYTSWERASTNPLVFLDWSDWNSTPTDTVETIMTNLMQGTLPPVADLSAHEDYIPPPPNVFSVGRAQQWFDGLTTEHQRRFLFSLNRRLANITEPALANDEEPATRGTRRGR